MTNRLIKKLYILTFALACTPLMQSTRAQEASENVSAPSKEETEVRVKAIDPEFYKTHIAPIKNSTGVVFVKIGASWCPPCEKMVPIVSSLKEMFDGAVLFVEISIEGLRSGKDVETSFLKEFFDVDVKSIPMFLIFKNGKLVETLIGSRSKQVLSDKLLELLTAEERALVYSNVAKKAAKEKAEAADLAEKNAARTKETAQ